MPDEAEQPERTRWIAALEGITKRRGADYRKIVVEASAQYKVVHFDMAGYESRHEAMQLARNRGLNELSRLIGEAAAWLAEEPHAPDNDAAVAEATKDVIAAGEAYCADLRAVGVQPSTAPLIPVLPSVDGVLDDIGENLHYYAPEGGIVDPAEASDRMIRLVANTMQALACDMADIADENSAITIPQVVDKIRERATKLSPESARVYDPKSGWEEGWDD